MLRVLEYGRELSTLNPKGLAGSRGLVQTVKGVGKIVSRRDANL